jgi:hypothetical protein
MSTNPSVTPLIEQFQLQSRLFNNVLDGIKSTDNSKRVSDNLNHVSWQAGHVVFARYLLAGTLGIKDANPYDELYSNFRPLDPNVKYPGVEEAKAKFAEITGKIIPALQNITDENLSAALPFKIPIGDNTVRGMIAFLSHHEAYHIGQLSTLRKYLGYGPMKY